MPYRKVYHHVRRHRKRYTRFIIFFVFLLAYGVFEDLISLFIQGIEFDIVVLVTVIIIATIFTTVAELTEKLVERKEHQKIIRFVKKEEKAIKKKLIKK